MSVAADGINPPRRVYLVAGEPSGDLLAAGLLRELKRRLPRARFRGVGGKHLRDAGLDLFADSSELAVMGLWEVLLQLRKQIRHLRRVTEDIQRFQPDLLIPVDFPGFNLALLQRLHSLPKKVVWFVSPKFWAWRYHRIHRIVQETDQVLCIFPFEVEPYHRAGGHAVYEGHPLVDLVHSDMTVDRFRQLHDLAGDLPLITFFPGSRRQEIERLLPLAIQVAKQKRSVPVSLAVHLAQPDLLPVWEPQLRQAGITPLTDPSHDAMRGSDLAFIASGTANLEAALLGVPQIMYYRMHPLTWQVAKRLVHLQWASPVNILLGREAIPELIQSNLQMSLVREIERFLEDPSRRRAELLAAQTEVTERAGRPGVFARLVSTLPGIAESADNE